MLVTLDVNEIIIERKFFNDMKRWLLQETNLDNLERKIFFKRDKLLVILR